jgi:hypothetical protein
MPKEKGWISEEVQKSNNIWFGNIIIGRSAFVCIYRSGKNSNSGNHENAAAQFRAL